MRHSKFLRLLAALAMVARFGFGQQPSPPANAPTPPPAAGAERSDQPGPPTKSTGPGERTSDAGQPKPAAKTGGHGDFLAIGAPPDPAAVKRGQATFVANCAFCHGSNAHGGNGGPDLVRSVLVLHDKGTGAEISPVILKGRTAKGMPAFPFNETQIKDIAAFLLSRNQAAANRMEYKILNIVTGDPKAGQAYFQSNCASCHSANNDLAHIASKFEPVDLQSRFLYPREPRGAEAESSTVSNRAAKTVTVTLPSGQSFSGKLDHLDDFSVALTESSGEHRSWSLEEEKGIRVDVHDPLEKHAELLAKYTNRDMHNVLAYLETLK